MTLPHPITDNGPIDRNFRALLESLNQITITTGGPSGAAGGVLSGTYPDPGFASDMATQAELDAVYLGTHGENRYVSTTGSDANDGLTWGTAKATIAGVEATLSGSTRATVNLSGGTHSITSSINLATGRIKAFIGIPHASGSGSYTKLLHDFDGNMFEGIADASNAVQGIALRNLNLAADTSHTGAAIYLKSSSVYPISFCYFENLTITGTVGWERDVVIDGSLHPTLGARTCFFSGCNFFGATSGETVKVTSGVHIFFSDCYIVQAPATGVTQNLKILNTFSENCFWRGEVLGNITAEGAGVGCYFSGTVTDDVTFAASSDKNVFSGVIGGTYTNSGGSGNVAFTAETMAAKADAASPGGVTYLGDLDITGTTDEAATIQAAIDAKDAAGGGVVVLPPTDFGGGGGIKVASLIDVPAAVRLIGQGKIETKISLTAAAAGLRFNNGGGANARSGESGHFWILGNNTASVCMETDAVNHNFTDIKITSPKAAGGIGLLCKGAQNNNFWNIEVEDTAHTGSGETYGIVFTHGAAGCNFFGCSLNQLTGNHILFTQDDASTEFGASYPRNINFYGFMIERSDTVSPIVHIECGANIGFSGGNFSHASFTPTAEYDIVLIDNTAPYSYSNVGAGGGITKNIRFEGVQMDGALNAGTRYARAFTVAADTYPWGPQVLIGGGMQYQNCKHAVSVEHTSCEVKVLSHDDIGISGGFDRPGAAGRSNTRTIASASPLAPKNFIDFQKVTGTTSFTTITPTYAGHRLTLYFSGVLNVSSGGNIQNLNTSPFVTASGDTLSLLCDGTDWFVTDGK